MLLARGNVARCCKHVATRTSSLATNRETYCCTGEKRVVRTSRPPFRWTDISLSVPVINCYVTIVISHFVNMNTSVKDPFTANCYKNARDSDPGKILKFGFWVETSGGFVIARRPGTANTPVRRSAPMATRLELIEFIPRLHLVAKKVKWYKRANP